MILVVEDEPALREVEVAYLLKAGFELIEASSGPEALQLFREHHVDLIVLDINLPDMNGLQVMRHIRERSHVPIIMVTARNQDADELIGFKYGTNDYLRKPFNPNILVARAKAILERTKTKTLHVFPFVVNPETMTVKKDEKLIDLTAMQFSLLYAFMQRPNVVMTREQLIEATHNDTPEIFDRTIDAHIKSLRQKIEDNPSQSSYIQTVYGRGYRFVGAVHA